MKMKLKYMIKVNKINNKRVKIKIYVYKKYTKRLTRFLIKTQVFL